MSNSGYLSPALPRIFAHRGLALSFTENTIDAFGAAILAGATHIESDLQLTRDGVPVLFHDSDLLRVAGLRRKISEISIAELQALELSGNGQIPTLEQALLALPNARFNLDFKVEAVVAPAAAVINRLGAHDRILVASFSESRRRRAVAAMNAPVVSSAGSWLVLSLWLAHKLNASALIARLAKRVQLLQLPLVAGKIRLDDAAFIAAMTAAGLEVHFWTINEVEQMKDLIRLGAHGIVTDRADVAVNTLRMR